MTSKYCVDEFHFADFEPSKRFARLVEPNATFLLADFLSFLLFDADGEVFLSLAVFLPVLLLVVESDL